MFSLLSAFFFLLAILLLAILSSCYSFFFLHFLLSSLSSFFTFFFLRSLLSSPLLSVSSVLKAFFNFNPSHSIPSLTDPDPPSDSPSPRCNSCFLFSLCLLLSCRYSSFFLRSLFSSPLLSVSSVLKAFLNFNPSHSIPSLTSSAPQTLHSKHLAAPARAAPRFHLVSPTPPTPAVRIVPPASLHTPARCAPHQLRPVAATPEIIPLRAPAGPTASPSAPPAIARFARHSRRLRQRARSPTAAPPKMNALPPQIPGTLHAASISGCASIRIPASPNLKSRNGDNPLPAKSPPPFHRTPPFRLRLARLQRCIAPRPAAAPSQVGCLHQPPANKSKRALARAPSIHPATAASFLVSGAAIQQSNRN